MSNEKEINKKYHIILLSYHRPSMPWLIRYLKEHKVKKIAYIMNAAKREVLKYTDFIFNDKNKLSNAGFEIDVINLDKNGNLEKDLFNYDVIYVRGGNTFDLLDSVRKSGFDKILPKLLNKEKIYVSSSAGSILLSPSIEFVENDFMSDINLVGLKDKSGLEILDFGVFPHWEDNFEAKLDKLSTKLKIEYPIIKLKDNQLVLINNGKINKLTV